MKGPLELRNKLSQVSRRLVVAGVLATAALTGGCAVYPVGPGGPVVVGPAPIVVRPAYGYGYGYHRGWGPGYGHGYRHGYYGHRY
jgi:hypothetical protein